MKPIESSHPGMAPSLPSRRRAAPPGLPSSELPVRKRCSASSQRGWHPSAAMPGSGRHRSVLYPPYVPRARDGDGDGAMWDTQGRRTPPRDDHGRVRSASDGERACSSPGDGRRSVLILVRAESAISPQNAHDSPLTANGRPRLYAQLRRRVMSNPAGQQHAPQSCPG
jgi:hypothetical protein